MLVNTRGDFISPAITSRNNAHKVLSSYPEFSRSITRDKLTEILRKAEDGGNLLREEYMTENRKPRWRYKVAPTAPS